MAKKCTVSEVFKILKKARERGEDMDVAIARCRMLAKTK